MNFTTKDAILTFKNKGCHILLCSTQPNKPFTLKDTLDNFLKTANPEDFFIVFSFSPDFMLKYSFQKPQDTGHDFRKAEEKINPYIEPSELLDHFVIDLGKYKLTPPEIYEIISRKHQFTSEEYFRSKVFPDSCKEFGLNTSVNLNLNSVNYTKAFRSDNVTCRIFLTHYLNSSQVSGYQTVRQLLDKTDVRNWWIVFRYENGISRSYGIMKTSRLKWAEDNYKLGNTVIFSDLGYENVCLGEYNSFDPDFISHLFKDSTTPYNSMGENETARDCFISMLSTLQINLDQNLVVKQYQDSGS